ncbi:MAG: hypothetical protein IJT91_02910 [Clostridia bacterium]|nr:hypothetical protein [Clostridia bacterium]
MNTKKLRNTLLIALALVAVCLTSVFGTLAYLKATQSVSNTFSVGDIAMKLDETDVDNGGRTETGNDYKLIPGTTYVKDPTVTITANSEACYVRVLVTVTNASAWENAFGITAGNLALSDISSDINANWTFVAKTTNGTNDTATFEYRYNAVVALSATDTVLPAVFETITVPGTADAAGLAALANAHIDVVANAMQSQGFADADAAWASFGA